MKKLLFFATFLYLIIAPLTYHPDNKLVLFWAGQEQGTVWNIWSYGQEHFTTEGQFNYPPLHFYLDKLQYWVAHITGGPGFDNWLASSNGLDARQEHLAQYSFSIKLVLIVFTILVGYLIYLVAKQYNATENTARWAAALWLFNPIVIYSVPILGQNDVMAIMLFLVGWLLLARSQLGAGILFGLSASVKMYPLLWLPFLLLPDPRLSLKEKCRIIGIGIGTYILTLLPFMANATFRQAVLNSDINDRFFIGHIDLGFTEAIFIVPLLLLLALYAVYKTSISKKFPIEQLSGQAFAVVACNLLLLCFSHFHPQWFTWLIPFWALWIVTQKQFSQWWVTLLSALTIGAWAFVVMMFDDSYLTFGLLVPLNPAWANLPIMREFALKAGIDVIKYNNFAHTWLAAVASIGLITLFSRKDSHTETTLVFSWPRLHFPRLINFFGTLLLSAIIMCVITIATYLIPAPRSSQSPVITTYIPLTEGIDQTFTAEESNFNRVDLYFRNPNLENNDDFTLSVYSSEPNSLPLVSTHFTGFNTGDPGVIRFDIPQQPNSKNKAYYLKITPTAGMLESASTNLQIGMIGTDTIALKSYYGSDRGLKAAAWHAVEALRDVINQVWWVYVVATIALFLAL